MLATVAYGLHSGQNATLLRRHMLGIGGLWTATISQGDGSAVDTQVSSTTVGREDGVTIDAGLVAPASPSKGSVASKLADRESPAGAGDGGQQLARSGVVLAELTRVDLAVVVHRCDPDDGTTRCCTHVARPSVYALSGLLYIWRSR